MGKKNNKNQKQRSSGGTNCRSSMGMDLSTLYSTVYGEEEDQKRRKKIEQEEKRAAEKKRAKKTADRDIRKPTGRAGGNPYVGAPYNFIPVQKAARYPAEQIPAQNSMEAELLSGSILYEMKAIQPICVGGEKEEEVTCFYRDADGRFAVPGSTMRGMIRSNAQILSFSYIEDDVEDRKLMYREVAGGPLQEAYNNTLGNQPTRIRGKSVSVLKNVRCGYLKNEGGRYTIYGTVNDFVLDQDGCTNYYVISERSISENPGPFEYLYSEGMPILQYAKGTAFYREGVHYKAAAEQINKDYKPFHVPISYQVGASEQIVSVKAPDARNPKLRRGELVGTGFMNEKKALYIIPEMDRRNEVCVVPKRDIDAYQIDLNNKKTIFESNGTWQFYFLPEDGQVRPVFYIYLDERLYFGYTPRLRLFFKHTTKEGLMQKRPDMDYARAIFGYTEEKDSRRTRVSFTDAVVCAPKGNASVIQEEETVRKYILNTPKPTSYLDYVVQPGGGKTASYNDDQFAIRGIKQYWNKETTDSQAADADSKEKVMTKFKVLPPGTRFRGEVRFHNLRRDELGLLLWSLEPDEKNQQNIGRAKPYGYGTVQVKISGIRQFDLKKAYDSASLSLDPQTDISAEKENLIQAYKDTFRDELYAENGEYYEQIDAFLKMKTNTVPNERSRYMSLDGKEYQKRKKGKVPLPTVNEVLEE